MLTRTSQDPPTYAVVVYLPEARRLDTTLRWGLDGGPVLDPSVADAWARDETLKLARVLKRTPKPHLSRWRG